MTYWHKNVYVVEHSLFGDTLADEYGRYNTDGKCPNDNDKLHLGKLGIKKFVLNIKSCIFRKGKNSRRRHSASGGKYSTAAKNRNNPSGGSEPTV